MGMVRSWRTSASLMCSVMRVPPEKEKDNAEAQRAQRCAEKKGKDLTRRARRSEHRGHGEEGEKEREEEARSRTCSVGCAKAHPYNCSVRRAALLEVEV